MSSSSVNPPITPATPAAAQSTAFSPIAQNSPSPFWPAAIWLLIQLAALALAAFGIPLSARFPVPAESLGMHEMLIVQTFAAALLLPFLFRTFTSTIIVATTAPLFLLLSAIMAAHSDTRTLVWCAIFISLWLLAMAAWNATVKLPTSKMVLVAIWSLFIIGGAALAYFRREFAMPAQQFRWSQVAFAGPAVGGIVILEQGPTSGIIWAELGFALVSAAIWHLASRLLGRKRN